MKKLKIILEMIKFEHTIFALPFAYIGAVVGSFVAAGGWPAWDQIVWITLAMVGARSAAMALNRLIDRFIDARNPRTQSRAIPAGLVSIRSVLLFVLGSFLLLFVSAYMLNPLAVQLLPIAVFVLVIYSYTKRFTWACHFVLGTAIGLAPLGGWVGATGTLHIEAIFLFIAVALWTAGFDIIYATQDVDFDRKTNIYSVPRSFGIKKGLIISRTCHVFAASFLFLLYFLAPLGWLYLLGCVLAALILLYEHVLVKHDDLSKVNVAFFAMNGILSMVVFLFVLGDLILL